MISQKQLKFYRSLKQKKYRRREGKFLIEGVNLIEAALDGFGRLLHVLTTPERGEEPRISKLADDARKRGIPVDKLDEKALRSLCEAVTPQGVVAVAEMPPNAAENILHGRDRLILVLDRVSDPGNVGTILRTAEWFGIGSVVCSRGCADLFSGKVLRASAGALFYVPRLAWDVDLQVFLPELAAKGVRIFAADSSRGSPYWQESWESPLALAIGNERHGVGDWTESTPPRFVRIPGKGRTDSLNAAMAAAILVSYISLNSA